MYGRHKRHWVLLYSDVPLWWCICGMYYRNERLRLHSDPVIEKFGLALWLGGRLDRMVWFVCLMWDLHETASLCTNMHTKQAFLSHIELFHHVVCYIHISHSVIATMCPSTKDTHILTFSMTAYQWSSVHPEGMFVCVCVFRYCFLVLILLWLARLGEKPIITSHIHPHTLSQPLALAFCWDVRSVCVWVSVSGLRVRNTPLL